MQLTTDMEAAMAVKMCENVTRWSEGSGKCFEKQNKTFKMHFPLTIRPHLYNAFIRSSLPAFVAHSHIQAHAQTAMAGSNSGVN